METMAPHDLVKEGAPHPGAPRRLADVPMRLGEGQLEIGPFVGLLDALEANMERHVQVDRERRGPGEHGLEPRLLLLLAGGRLGRTEGESEIDLVAELSDVAWPRLRLE